MEEHKGQVNFHSQLAAINQRNRLIEQQQEQSDVLRKQKDALDQQTVALHRQNQIEQKRSKIEEQRLNIERQRLAAEEAERKLRQQRAERLRQLRCTIADTAVSLERFKKKFLA